MQKITPFLWFDGKAEEAMANLIALSMEVFDLERVQRYARRLVEINPRSVPGLQGLTLVAVERGEMEVAARHFAVLAEQAPDLRGTQDEDVMAYRVSGKAIDRIRECISRQPVQPAARRY